MSINGLGGNSVQVFDSTVVAIHTDSGISGYGEVCPLGPAYLAAYANGVRAGIAELAPSLIGLDPTALSVVNDCMDHSLSGHPYVKSALDIACWDILGKLAVCPSQLYSVAVMATLFRFTGQSLRKVPKKWPRRSLHIVPRDIQNFS